MTVSAVRAQREGRRAPVSFGRFLGVGVSDSGDVQPVHLDHAVPDVAALIDLLGDAFEPEILRNPAESTIRKRLKKLPGSVPGGPLVVLWCGHAVASAADSLRLLARDSTSSPAAGIGISDVVASCAESGANQLLFLVDTCFSGAAAKAGEVAAAIMRSRPPEGKYVWVGVLASCLNVETARDGLFGQRLRKLLADGPRTPELRVRWSPHSQYVRGDDVCDAVLKEWDSDVQSPDFSGRGSAWWVFPNPLYDAGAPEQVVEHLLQAARGGAGIYERSWFTGRTTEVNGVVDWIRSGRPGVHVITGSAGTGKSAIAGRLVSLSNPEERERLLGDGHSWEHQDPGIRSVQAHVHARGLTADRAAAVIADQLVAAKVLEPQREPRNASELVGQVQRTVAQGMAPPVVVVDGLDEARGEAFSIADELLARLAPHAVVVVSTRELSRGDDRPTLLGLLAPVGSELDLDDPAAQDRTRADLSDYITARLAGRDPRMDAEAVAENLVGEASMTADRPFLLARLVTDQLRASPLDTSLGGWQQRVSKTIEDAFDADLAEVDSPPRRPKIRDKGVLARSLLSALTWGYGAGLPEDEWLAVANALLPGSVCDRDDLLWLLGQLGRYVVQDGEAGVAVYRVAHQSLAEHLHPAFEARHDQLFDPQALPVAESLATRYQVLLAGGVPATDPAYLWRYLWRHAADSGPNGLKSLRELASTYHVLQFDVAMAALEIAIRMQHWGHLKDAVAPTEEATGIYRDLASVDPAFVPGLAQALNNLGVCYRDVGRHQDAIAPTHEATRRYRALAKVDAAYLPDLAMALANLGTSYTELGRRIDGIPPAEEAVQIYRDLVGNDPTYRPGLAGALNNLGASYSDVGRRNDGITCAEEAVRLYRGLIGEDPVYLADLAMALNNLGSDYGYTGRWKDALAPTEDAVQLYRDLARDNPAYLPGLVSALNNLGFRYSEVGRRKEGIAPTEEAVRLYRALARDNSAYLPGLAGGLINIGKRYAEAGRYQDTVAPTEEAVRLYRDLASGNPAHFPGLAMAINNLGTSYCELGRYGHAVTLAEEAAQLYRDLARENVGYLPELAMALTNLGNAYAGVSRKREALASAREAAQLYRDLARDNAGLEPGLASALINLGFHFRGARRHREAIAPIEEAVQLYGRLAGDNPEYLPDLAAALNNLGDRYLGVGRREDALAPIEEAVRLYYGLAGDNPERISDLAAALFNLSARYSAAGRHQEALASIEEAMHRRRRLAADDPTLLPDLAATLTVLSARQSETGHGKAGIASAEEAVRIYSGLAREARTHFAGLARTLNSLSSRYREMGRDQQAIEVTERAMLVYSDRARDDPVYLPSLADTLKSLTRHYREANEHGLEEAAWQTAMSGRSPTDTAYLLNLRAATAAAGQPEAARWLAASLQLASGNRDLTAAVHEQARRHLAADHGAFSAAWVNETGRQLPGWLTVDAKLLAVAKDWMNIKAYGQQRDFLLSHPELLDPAIDDAFSEALQYVREDTAQGYAMLRRAARDKGVEAAYRPLLRSVLADTFTAADSEGQRALLATRRDDLLSSTVRASIESVAANEGNVEILRARALLELAAISEHEPILDALSQPTSFPSLLHDMACRPDLIALNPAAEVALTAATTAGQAATALFYLAIATAAAADVEAAIETLVEARRMNPGQEPTWIGVLADIGQHHAAVLPLITALTLPLDDLETPEAKISGEGAERTDDGSH